MRTILLMLASVIVTATGVVACSGAPRDLCVDNEVRCAVPLSCDPEDGICKCGGAGGVVCPDGFACDEEANTCLSTRCVGVSCSTKPGTSCDVLDGECKCGGTGGEVCSADEVCNPATKQCQLKVDCSEVVCGTNQTCDPDTGLCSCGTSFCEAGQSCAVGTDGSRTCVADLCTGVNCLGGTSCDPTDGVCKCNGAACTAGQVCGCPAGDAGTCADAERSCQSGSACANVTCGGGTTCDPADGQCKCGGPGGPVCGTDQVCSLTTGQCQGGDQCKLADGTQKNCTGGTSCDPEDGLCKCGGRGGQVCGDGTNGKVEETCVITAFSQVCRPTCDPRLQNCASGTYCYWDTLAKTPTAYCAVNSDTNKEGEGCANPTACFTTNPTSKGLFCKGLGTFEEPGGAGAQCRAFCDTAAGTSGCSQVVAQTCEQILGAPAGVGHCQPVKP